MVLLLGEANSFDRLEGFVLQLLVQLTVIVAASLFGGACFGRLGQPRVVGEILAGLILGPSLLGMLFPTTLELLFPAEMDQQLRVLGQLGLILLMFEVGLAFDFRHLTEVKSAAASVAIAGMALPFALAMALSYWMHPHVAAGFPRLPFALFVATAVSITAIPILGRIMIDLKIEKSAIAVLTISAAAIDDALGWILLAVISSLVTGGFRYDQVAIQLVSLTAFVVLSVCFVPRFARWICVELDWFGPKNEERSSKRKNIGDPVSGLAILLLVVFLFAMITNWIGVFSVFGPFVLGACLSQRTEIYNFYRSTASHFVAAFLLPVFFTFTGLRTDVGSLDLQQWAWCGAIVLVACAGKILGCGLVARLYRYSWKQSAALAIMMNTRALMGLVAINVGRDLGAIPDSVFSMLVVMAISTTVITVPVLKRLI